MKLSMALAALLFAAPLAAARATSLEDAYIAARDRYLKHFEQIAASEAADKEQKPAIDDLEKQLKAIIGPIAVKGVDPTPRSNVDTLSSGDDTFGHLDALAFGPLGNQQTIVVTTERLLKNWLKVHESWWGDKEARMPQLPGAALKTEGFYTQAIGYDAAFMFYAELPIVKPPTASFAVAYLYLTAQDIGAWKPNEVLVSVIQGGKLYIVSMPAKTSVPAIPACDAIWKAAEKKSAQATEKSGQFSEDIRVKGDKDFHRCFAERAKSEPFFARLTAEAQSLLDALPLK
jgi:hypothetical protein